MIRHVSVSVQNPRRVADVLAEIVGGCCYPSPGWIAESWMVVRGDSAGTMIEVCPADMAQHGCGNGEVAGAVRQRSASLRFLLAVSSDLGTIQRIAAREGWLTRLVGRGAPGQEPFFNVVEFWIENTVMLEIVPEDMMDTYTDWLQPPMPDALFGGMLAAYRPGPLLDRAARRLGGLVGACLGLRGAQSTRSGTARGPALASKP